jgi:hypothetical protein
MLRRKIATSIVAWFASVIEPPGSRAVKTSWSDQIMFFLFSRRLGCAGSLLISAGLTVLLLYLLGWL